MTKLELRIYKWPPVRSVIDATKKVVLPGKERVTLYEVSRFFIRELNNIKLIERAAAVTYNFLMAMPPTFLFLLSLVPYLPLNGVQKTILTTLRLVTPNNYIYQSVSKVVIDFMNTQRNDVLGFGVVLILFFSSNGMMGLMRSFDRSLALYKKRSSLSRRWTAIKLTFVLIGVMIVSLAILIIQTERLNFYVLKIFHNILAVKLLSLLIFVIIIFCAICIIYTYGPSLTHRFKFVSVGSIFATLLSVITSLVFFYLVNNFINYNKVYGSIGTLTAFMVWVWLNTLVILIGYELNVSILLGKLSHKRHAKKSI
ncbi:MAG TPA: YihY/virulence factor BrkB family protein [Flavipsychrobacter sp.]|nr:YihY/virulence factor BrkB family protein [Flavipsychrobacter sp.]